MPGQAVFFLHGGKSREGFVIFGLIVLLFRVIRQAEVLPENQCMGEIPTPLPCVPGISAGDEGLLYFLSTPYLPNRPVLRLAKSLLQFCLELAGRTRPPPQPLEDLSLPCRAAHMLKDGSTGDPGQGLPSRLASCCSCSPPAGGAFASAAQPNPLPAFAPGFPVSLQKAEGISATG